MDSPGFSAGAFTPLSSGKKILRETSYLKFKYLNLMVKCPGIKVRGPLVSQLSSTTHLCDLGEIA